ncbi:hypothetical protein P7K49_007522, partial [Saguinus oedipus]
AITGSAIPRKARQSHARQSTAVPGKAMQDKQGKARQSHSRQGKASQSNCRQDKA